MEDRTFIFPKGEYYFGDLSYVIDNPEWEDLFCFNGEGDWDFKDKEYLWFYTRENGWFLKNYWDYFVDLIIILSDTTRQGYARYSRISLKARSVSLF